MSDERPTTPALPLQASDVAPPVGDVVPIRDVPDVFVFRFELGPDDPGLLRLDSNLQIADIEILAGMATFLWKGMRPRYWWLEERASRRARAGLAISVGLFVALAAAVVVSRGLG